MILIYSSAFLPCLSDTVAYRLNLMTEEGSTRSALLHNKRTLVAPALT